MPILLVILLGALGWALWAGKIKFNQLPPIVLGIAGILAAAKGAWIPGVALIGVSLAWYRGLTWRLSSLRSKNNPKRQLEDARRLLGATARDDANTVRTLHRKLITENHPDTGGNVDRASALNEARDLLLADLKNREQ